MKFPRIIAFVFGLALSVVPLSRAPAQTAEGTPPPNPVPAPGIISVKMVAPTNGQIFVAPGNVQLSADALDFGAVIDHIAFYSGSNVLFSAVVDPVLPLKTNGQVINFQFNWTGVAAGAYTLTAVVSDTMSRSATSAPVNIQIVTMVPPPVPVVTIYAIDPIAVEGTNFPAFTPASTAAPFFPVSATNNTATFLIHRTTPTNNSVTVFYTIGGTASNGVDYVQIPNNVTIPAGKTYALITITPIKRVTPVAAAPFYRTVILGLTQPSTAGAAVTYTIGFPSKAEAFILERRLITPLSPVAVMPAPPAIGPLADGSYNVTYSAANGLNYCIEASTDLINWTPICGSTVVKGSIVFADPDSANYQSRYYRVVPSFSAPIY